MQHVHQKRFRYPGSQDSAQSGHENTQSGLAPHPAST